MGYLREAAWDLIYINDISNTSNEGGFILFADDTNIFVRGQTALLSFKTANEILRKVTDYTGWPRKHYPSLSLKIVTGR